MATRREFIAQAATATIALDILAGMHSVSASPKRPMGSYKIINAGLTVSRIAYGCMMLGWDKDMQFDEASLARWAKEPLRAAAIDEADRLIHLAYDQGVTLFDMADMYAFGKSEAAVGAVLKRSPQLRDGIVIQSKCASRYSDDPRPGDPNRPDCSREQRSHEATSALIWDDATFNWDLAAYTQRYLTNVRDDQDADGAIPHVAPEPRNNNALFSLSPGQKSKTLSSSRPGRRGSATATSRSSDRTGTR